MTNRGEKALFIEMMIMSIAASVTVGCGVMGERGLITLISVMVAGIAAGVLFVQNTDEESFVKPILETFLFLVFLIFVYILFLLMYGHLF